MSELDFAAYERALCDKLREQCGTALEDVVAAVWEKWSDLCGKTFQLPENMRGELFPRATAVSLACRPAPLRSFVLSATTSSETVCALPSLPFVRSVLGRGDAATALGLRLSPNSDFRVRYLDTVYPAWRSVARVTNDEAAEVSSVVAEEPKVILPVFPQISSPLAAVVILGHGLSSDVTLASSAGTIILYTLPHPAPLPRATLYSPKLFSVQHRHLLALQAAILLRATHRAGLRRQLSPDELSLNKGGAALSFSVTHAASTLQEAFLSNDDGMFSIASRSLASGINLRSPEDAVERPRISPAVPAPISVSPGLAAARQAWATGDISSFDYIAVLNAAAGRVPSNPFFPPVFPWVVCKVPSGEACPPITVDILRDLSVARHRLCLQEAQLRAQAATTGFHFSEHLSDTTLFTLAARSLPHAVLARHVRRHFSAVDAPQSAARVLECSSDEALSEMYYGGGAWLGLQALEGIDPSNEPSRTCSIESEDDAPHGHVRQSSNVTTCSNLSVPSALASEALGPVELPEWCYGDPSVLVDWLRHVLDSDIVASSLPHWIDLTFGYLLDNSDAAKEALNVPRTAVAPVTELRCDGVCRLFHLPHPHRTSGVAVVPLAPAPEPPAPRQRPSMGVTEDEAASVTAAMRAARAHAASEAAVASLARIAAEKECNAAWTQSLRDAEGLRVQCPLPSRTQAADWQALVVALRSCFGRGSTAVNELLTAIGAVENEEGVAPADEYDDPLRWALDDEALQPVFNLAPRWMPKLAVSLLRLGSMTTAEAVGARLSVTPAEVPMPPKPRSLTSSPANSVHGTPRNSLSSLPVVSVKPTISRSQCLDALCRLLDHRTGPSVGEMILMGVDWGEECEDAVLMSLLRLLRHSAVLSGPRRAAELQSHTMSALSRLMSACGERHRVLTALANQVSEMRSAFGDSFITTQIVPMILRFLRAAGVRERRPLPEADDGGLVCRDVAESLAVAVLLELAPTLDAPIVAKSLIPPLYALAVGDGRMTSLRRPAALEPLASALASLGTDVIRVVCLPAVAALTYAAFVDGVDEQVEVVNASLRGEELCRQCAASLDLVRTLLAFVPHLVKDVVSAFGADDPTVSPLMLILGSQARTEVIDTLICAVVQLLLTVMSNSGHLSSSTIQYIQNACTIIASSSKCSKLVGLACDLLSSAHGPRTPKRRRHTFDSSRAGSSSAETTSEFLESFLPSSGIGETAHMVDKAVNGALVGGLVSPPRIKQELPPAPPVLVPFLSPVGRRRRSVDSVATRLGETGSILEVSSSEESTSSLLDSVAVPAPPAPRPRAPWPFGRGRANPMKPLVGSPEASFAGLSGEELGHSFRYVAGVPSTNSSTPQAVEEVEVPPMEKFGLTELLPIFTEPLLALLSGLAPPPELPAELFKSKDGSPFSVVRTYPLSSSPALPLRLAASTTCGTVLAVCRPSFTHVFTHPTSSGSDSPCFVTQTRRIRFDGARDCALLPSGDKVVVVGAGGLAVWLVGGSSSANLKSAVCYMPATASFNPLVVASGPSLPGGFCVVGLTDGRALLVNTLSGRVVASFLLPVSSAFSSIDNVVVADRPVDTRHLEDGMEGHRVSLPGRLVALDPVIDLHVCATSPTLLIVTPHAAGTVDMRSFASSLIYTCPPGVSAYTGQIVEGREGLLVVLGSSAGTVLVELSRGQRRAFPLSGGPRDCTGRRFTSCGTRVFCGKPGQFCVLELGTATGEIGWKSSPVEAGTAMPGVPPPQMSTVTRIENGLVGTAWSDGCLRLLQ